MTILTMPNVLASSLKWHLRANTMTSRSTLNRATKTRELPGAMWMATFDYTNKPRSEWAIMDAFISQLRGAAGRCYVTPPHAAVIQGSGGGTPLVDGAGQVGNTINIKGATANASAWLKIGDYFSFDATAGREMKKVVSVDVATDSFGNATITFEPPTRNAPADGAAITISSPSCVMHLVDDDQGILSMAPPLLGGLSVQFEEIWS